jgi:dCMP deaminase
MSQSNWHKFFVSMAELASTKSKDRSTKVGAVIVGTSNNVLSIGFNGFPRGVNDDVEARHERPLKYSLTEHAERNAIYNAARHGIRLEGATLYLNCGGLPCDDCARAIIQSGIIKVVSMNKPFNGAGGIWEEKERVSAEMFKESGVKVVRLSPEFEELVG